MKAVNITMKAHKQISKLNKQDIGLIYEALEKLEQYPDTQGVKALVNMGGYRLRIGRYRALFTVSDDAITVTEVKIRNEHTY